MNRKLIKDYEYGYYFKNPKTSNGHRRYQYMIIKHDSLFGILLKQCLLNNQSARNIRYHEKSIKFKDIKLVLWVKEL